VSDYVRAIFASAIDFANELLTSLDISCLGLLRRLGGMDKNVTRCGRFDPFRPDANRPMPTLGMGRGCDPLTAHGGYYDSYGPGQGGSAVGPPGSHGMGRGVGPPLPSGYGGPPQPPPGCGRDWERGRGGDRDSYRSRKRSRSRSRDRDRHSRRR